MTTLWDQCLSGHVEKEAHQTSARTVWHPTSKEPTLAVYLRFLNQCLLVFVLERGGL